MVKKRRAGGFTLTELLVVILIIVVLAALTFTVTTRIRTAAAKTTDMSNMRTIAAAAMVYGTEHNMLEPFYFANGTGTLPHEAGAGRVPTEAPENPAAALYSKDDPSQGYLQDYTVFFSPLSKAVPPSMTEYDPKAVNPIWGTYFWRHPFVPVDKRSARQARAIMNDPGEMSGPFNPNIEGRLLMVNAYGEWGEPKFGKPIYHAAMTDGSVQYVTDNTEKMAAWYIQR